MHKEQLTLVFLVFVVVVISSMVYHIPANAARMTLLIGVLATFLIPTTKKNKSSTCHHPHKTIKEEETFYKSKQIYYIDDNKETPSYRNLQEAENQFSEQDFDVMVYNNLDDVKSVYYDMACPGDNALSARMWEQGRRAQQSKDNRAKFDKYSMLHYVDEELRSVANSRWWDDDALEHRF